MKIISLTKDIEEQWDLFIENHPDATMYHLLGWKKVLEQIFKLKSYYLIALNNNDEVEGILPMFLMKDILQRKYLISNPFSNMAGICADNQEAINLIYQKAIEIANENNVRYIEFRQLNSKIIEDLPTKKNFVTLTLQLSEDSNNIWNAISSRNRNKIRKAKKNKLSVDYGIEYIEEFYSVYSKNLRYLGTPLFPFDMFRLIAKVFSNNIELLVLKKNKKIVSGMFLFKYKNMIFEPWVASLKEYNKIYVNNLLYWQAIKYACKEGFEYFDFGRSTIDSGTYTFKLQWGAKPVPLYYQYYLNRAKEIPVVDATNNKYQNLINIWKKLPLGITNFAGPKIVKYLPEL